MPYKMRESLTQKGEGIQSEAAASSEGVDGLRRARNESFNAVDFSLLR